MSESAIAEVLTQNSKAVSSNPILFRINGVGFGFAGIALRHLDLGNDYFVRMHWLTVAFVPFIPFGIYLLSHPVDQKGRPISGRYYIHRAVKIKGVTEIWGLQKFLWMLFSTWLILLGVLLLAGAAFTVYEMTKGSA